MKSAFKILGIFICLLGFAFARPDYRTYSDDIDTLAIWINPKKIKVYINDNSNKTSILTRAFDIWDDALRSNLNFVYVNSEQDADITIQYVDSLTKNQVGVAKTGYAQIQGKIYLTKVHVSISKTDPIVFIRNDAQLLKTTLHEIGHAIGIIGHSSNSSDIMYYSTASTKNSSPSLKDIETVNKLYGF